MVGNEVWRSLQVGNQYDLALRFDNTSPWRGRATARRIGSGNMVFLYLSFDRARFLVELARRQNMTIFYQGDVVTTLPLRGTNAAVQEMINCQRVADVARKTNGRRAIRSRVRRKVRRRRRWSRRWWWRRRWSVLRSERAVVRPGGSGPGLVLARAPDLAQAPARVHPPDEAARHPVPAAVARPSVPTAANSGAS